MHIHTYTDTIDDDCDKRYVRVKNNDIIGTTDSNIFSNNPNCNDHRRQWEIVKHRFSAAAIITVTSDR